MGLVLKNRKCRSLSLVLRKAVKREFHLKDTCTENPVNISSVLDKPFKFIESEITGENNSTEMFESTKSKLEDKLNNVNNFTLRGEHKLKTYSRSTLSSKRYYLSVRQINKTHMNKLEDVARKYLKLWLSIQTSGVICASIFHPYMLNVKSPSQLYKVNKAGKS